MRCMQPQRGEVRLAFGKVSPLVEEAVEDLQSGPAVW